MKIIRQGKLPEERLYRAICRNCNSMLEAEERELTSRSSEDEKSSTAWYEAECPYCKSCVTVWTYWQEPVRQVDVSSMGPWRDY